MFTRVRSNSVHCGPRVSVWHRFVQLDFADHSVALVRTISYFQVQNLNIWCSFRLGFYNSQFCYVLLWSIPLVDFRNQSHT